MPVIVVYRAGAKGDLLCNFLLDRLNFGLNGRNETTGDLNIILRNLDQNLSMKNEDTVADKAINAIKTHVDPICLSHEMDSYPDWALERIKETHDLVFIDYLEFRKNVGIDLLLKRHTQEASMEDKLIGLSMGFKGVKYKIDMKMLSEGYSLTFDDRRRFIKDKLSNEMNYYPLKPRRESYFEIIRYGDLFLPSFDGMERLMSLAGIEKTLDEWKSCVIKSYLPKEVDVFGEIVYPADYGYEWHYEKEE